MDPIRMVHCTLYTEDEISQFYSISQPYSYPTPSTHPIYSPPPIISYTWVQLLDLGVGLNVDEYFFYNLNAFA